METFITQTSQPASHPKQTARTPSSSADLGHSVSRTPVKLKLLCWREIKCEEMQQLHVASGYRSAIIQIGSNNDESKSVSLQLKEDSAGLG